MTVSIKPSPGSHDVGFSKHRLHNVTQRIAFSIKDFVTQNHVLLESHTTIHAPFPLDANTSDFGCMSLHFQSRYLRSYVGNMLANNISRPPVATARMSAGRHASLVYRSGIKVVSQCRLPATTKYSDGRGSWYDDWL